MNKIAFAPTSDDLAVRVRGVRKVYRLYRKPSYRLRDILGLLPNDPRYFTEHVALHDVTLEMRRGEKVAIIGRNGAGKSTLLKLITRVIQPTAGTITLSGETQALLSLGAGFHPELTGRQNVLAYLANFGINGEQAARMLDDIIDFAELEEYIDQPTKTYSSGMNVRLMFSASTMFVPDLLVIDEVLGVGDAYFQGKSFERIREMCTGQGTTLLLVTHDVYAASALCERMIWIDHGAVLLDAPTPTVLKAYETSIRQQEEARLRKKALLGAQRLAETARRRDVPMLIELRSPDNTPLPSPVAIGRIALLDGEREWRAALVDEAQDPVTVGSLVTTNGSWGDVIDWHGRQARQMKQYGSAVHKVGVCFVLPPDIANRADHMTLEVELSCDHDCPLEAWRIDPDMRARRVGIAATRPGEWIALRTPLSGHDLGTIETLFRPSAGEQTSMDAPLISDQAPTEPLLELSADDDGATDLQPVEDGNAVQDQLLERNANEQEPSELSEAPASVEEEHFAEAPSAAAAAEVLSASATPPVEASGAVCATSDMPQSEPVEALALAAVTAAEVQDREISGPSATQFSVAAQRVSDRPLLEFETEGPTPGDAAPSDAEPISTAASERHGSGRVVVTGLRFLDDSGEECLHLDHGRSYSVVLGYEINDPALKERCQVVFAFKRNGVDDVFRLFGKHLLFDASKASKGEIVAQIDRLPVGVGEYSITVLLAAENYYEEKPTIFYTLNPKVYWAARGVLDIKVVSDHLMPNGTGVVGEAVWSLR